MDVQNELHALGALTGRIEPDRAAGLTQIEGVAHVSESGRLRSS